MEPNEPKALAEALERLLTTPVRERVSVATAARRRLEPQTARSLGPVLRARTRRGRFTARSLMSRLASTWAPRTAIGAGLGLLILACWLSSISLTARSWLLVGGFGLLAIGLALAPSAERGRPD